MKNETKGYKEMMKELTGKIYVFTYFLVDPDEYVRIVEDGVPMHLTEKQLEWFASEWKKGGLREELDFKKYPKALLDELCMKAYEQSQEAVEEEGYGFGECSLLFDPMPVELELAVNRINGQPWNAEEYYFNRDKYTWPDGELLRIDVPYTYVYKGRIFHEVCPYSMRYDIANIMISCRQNKPKGMTDYEFMKQVSPEAYEYVRYDMYVNCNNTHLAEYGEEVEVCLTEFPEELFDYEEHVFGTDDQMILDDSMV